MRLVYWLAVIIYTFTLLLWGGAMVMSPMAMFSGGDISIVGCIFVIGLFFYPVSIWIGLVNAYRILHGRTTKEGSGHFGLYIFLPVIYFISLLFAIILLAIIAALLK